MHNEKYCCLIFTQNPNTTNKVELAIHTQKNNKVYIIYQVIESVDAEDQSQLHHQANRHKGPRVKQREKQAHSQRHRRNRN